MYVGILRRQGSMEGSGQASLATSAMQPTNTADFHQSPMPATKYENFKCFNPVKFSFSFHRTATAHIVLDLDTVINAMLRKAIARLR